MSSTDPPAADPINDYSIWLQLPLELWTLFILPSCSLEMSLVSPAWRHLAFPLTFHDPRVARCFGHTRFCILDSPCAHGHVSVVRELLQHPMLHLAAENHEPTYLLHACEYAHVEVVRLLLASPKVQSNITHAQANDLGLLHFNLKRILVEWGEKNFVWTPSVTRQVLILELILPEYPRLDDLFETACRSGLDTRILRLFLEHPRIDFEHDNYRSLRSACVCGILANIRLLLADKRLTVTVESCESLFLAINRYTIHKGGGGRKTHAVEILKVLLQDERIYNNQEACEQTLLAIAGTLFLTNPLARGLIRRWALALGIITPDQVGADVLPLLFVQDAT